MHAGTVRGTAGELQGMAIACVTAVPWKLPLQGQSPNGKEGSAPADQIEALLLPLAWRALFQSAFSSIHQTMTSSEIDGATTEADRELWVVTHTAEFLVQRTSARVNNFADVYFGIAQEAFNEYLLTENDPHLNDDDPDHAAEHQLASGRLLQSAIKTIVFAAMTCEAAIYDISAIHLSDDYARNVLDKLSPVSKWLVAPRLICGKSLSEYGPAINSLRVLFGARNELVHAKSLSGLGMTDPQRVKRLFTAANKQVQQIVSGAIPAYQTIVLLSLELERLFGTSSASLPMFSQSTYSSEYDDAPDEVKKVIRRCREIDANFTAEH